MTQGVLQNTLLALGFLFTSSTSSAPSDQLQIFPEIHQEAIHVVKKEETLATIAKNRYGDEDYWVILWSDNRWIEEPNVIEPGWRLKYRISYPENFQEVKNEVAKEIKLPVTPTHVPEPTGAEKTAFPEAIASSSVPPAAPTSFRPSNYDAVYREAGAKYGVSWEILYGLHLTETGLRDGDISNHQGSGAQGPMQFMPGTWRAYGVDGNGDGTADINNAVDAIHGAANFLAKHGTLDQGLRSYGGNTAGVLAAARARGFTQ